MVKPVTFGAADIWLYRYYFVPVHIIQISVALFDGVQIMAQVMEAIVVGDMKDWYTVNKI